MDSRTPQQFMVEAISSAMSRLDMVVSPKIVAKIADDVWYRLEAFCIKQACNLPGEEDSEFAGLVFDGGGGAIVSITQGGD